MRRSRFVIVGHCKNRGRLDSLRQLDELSGPIGHANGIEDQLVAPETSQRLAVS